MHAENTDTREPDVKHPTAVAKLNEAYAKLRGTISMAFDQERDYERTPVHERERLAAAVIAIAQFFAEVGDKQVSNRFFELGSAIADLNSGTPHPLLRPVRSHNRRADPSRLWRARARSAIGLEALIRSGLGVSAAAEKISKEHPRLAHLVNPRAGRSGLPKLLIGWRREFRSSRIKNFEAAELFSEGLRRLDLVSDKAARLHELATDQLAKAVSDVGVFSPHS
jgi:hypothetical protein